MTLYFSFNSIFYHKELTTVLIFLFSVKILKMSTTPLQEYNKNVPIFCNQLTVFNQILNITNYYCAPDIVEDFENGSIEFLTNFLLFEICIFSFQTFYGKSPDLK